MQSRLTLWFSGSCSTIPSRTLRCAGTPCLSRGRLESDHLPAVLAHELGHLASTDGRLTAALNRLVIHPPPTTRRTRAGQAQRADPLRRPSAVDGHDPGRAAVGFAQDGRVRQRRSRAADDRAVLGFALARTRVHRRPVRGRSRPGRGSRGLPWRSTPSCTTIPSPSSGSPNTPTPRQSCASTSCAAASSQAPVPGGALPPAAPDTRPLTA